MKRIGAPRRLRATARAAAAALLTLGIYLFFFAGSPVAMIRRRWLGRWQGFWFQAWSRGLCRILGVTIRAEGRPPRPPFLLVANHLSYLDILVLGSQIPCVFVAKGEVESWPVLGHLCRIVNTIFIDRNLKRDIPRALHQIEAALAGGQGVVVFPEATSSAGGALLPFRSPLLELSVRLGLPVHYAALSYGVPGGEAPAHLAVCWWGEMPFSSHVAQLLLLDRIEARLVFGPETVSAPDRKLLAERLWNAVAGIFTPVAGARPEQATER